MGRYSAPRFDDNQSTPMEWTAIPDESGEDDGIMMSNSFNRFSLGESSLSEGLHHGKSSNSVSTTKRTDENTRSQEIICLCRSDSQDGGTDERNNTMPYSQEIQPEFAQTTQGNDDGCLQTMYDEYIQNMDRQLLLEYQRRRSRRRRYFFGVTIVALVVLILHKYAPPPPPIKLVLPSQSGPHQDSDTTIFFNMFVGSSDGGRLSQQAVGRQHNSWSSYCRATMQIFAEASLHQLSVFWYAFSNAFIYASHEIRLAFVSHIKQCTQSLHNETDQTTENLHKQLAFTKTWCPIRIPATRSHHFSLPRGANAYSPENDEVIILPGLSTEEFLRQSMGASLSPQNLAITLLSEGIDKWGRHLVNSAPVSLVHRMSAAMDTGLWVDTGSQDDHTHQWILPPAIGVLLCGAEGVGKLHTARLLSRWMFGHCNQLDSREVCKVETEVSEQHCTDDQSTSQKLDGVLEILIEDTIDANQIKETIINHLIQRELQGSVIILHHIEALPVELLLELSKVINGKTQKLSYTNLNGYDISSSTNGCLFIFTSKQWGTKNIFEEIQNNRMKTIGLRRESLLSSIRWEVDSHFPHGGKMANKLTIAPLLPLQQEDLESILRSRIQYLNTKYQGLLWKRLHLSNIAIDYFLSTDHVEYFDLLGDDNDMTVSLTFSLRGGKALEGNVVVQTLHTKLISDRRGRPYKIAFVDLNAMEDDWETVLSWCNEDIASGLMEDCEEAWRLVLR